MTGVLFIVGTPIGNLRDLSIRGADTLRSVSAVICEDSRRTGKLLAFVGAGPSDDAESSGRRPDLIVANEHTEVPRVAEVLDRLAGGERLALVTDAGMPTISDPGYRIVAAAAEAGHRVEVVPGPTAVSSALALSGIDPVRFVFEGFLPRKGGERDRRLAALASEDRTIVLYEAPHRVRRTMADLVKVLGPERQAALCRELTKLHETTERGSLVDLARVLDEADPRGEYVIVAAGRPVDDEPMSDQALAAALRSELDRGLSRRDAVATVVAGSGEPKRRVYDLANSMNSAPGDR